ncbi:TRAP transporter permease [Natrarchaeobaculum aegyptiacum]|uniref:C4-dicarboxylate ABC transporter permease n=1 Tax=Natrarchaeobaculum aegyptiacum TaxID=745377 RepID=A0A2Z2HTG1_9EURY|nr:TRAP transporter fused permease subunit [Natrarchaeobaculum aegyptiacum]ARS90521.1 C4-dicarboxylate ABC transporter permease [Natrarchaeobaculum aegyptiacum]
MNVLSRVKSQPRSYVALNGVTSVLAVLFTAYTLHYAITLWTIRLEYSVIFLGLGLATFFFDEARKHFRPSSDDTPTEDVEAMGDGGKSGLVDEVQQLWARVDPYVAMVLGALSLAASAYVWINFQRLHEEVHLLGFELADFAVGLILIGLALEATRRAFGWVIAMVTVASIGYAHALIGPNLPGLLRHTGLDWTDVATEGAVGLTGVYHDTLMGIGSTWVAIFIMFAGIAKAYGLMDFVLEVGRELGKSLRTGVVQIAVIASMIMGSITGSAAANTATTGSFTIPMMKDQGIRSEYAASIEAVASAGGQMLPPVMGVAAFLMADFVDVPYVTIIQAGIIPAALFYLSVGIAVHFLVLKFGWTTPNTGSFDYRVLTKGIHFAVPLAVLLYFLIWRQFTPLTAGLYTIAVMFAIGIVVSLARKAYQSELSPRAPLEELETVVLGLRRGGLEMAPLVGVLAAMGIIIQMLTQTGLAQRTSTMIVGLGGGLLVVVLLLAMVASILFGLGMPTPAAYVLVVVLVAPGVMEMGVPEITTHMFVFYFAMLSAITPPVAISVAVGSRIANTDFMTACVNALRIGAPGFLIPFALITNESLIYWSMETLVAFPVVFAGTVAIIVATVRFDGARTLSLPWVGAYVVLSFAAMYGSILHVGVQLVAATVIVATLAHAKFVVGYDSNRVASPSSTPE